MSNKTKKVENKKSKKADEKKLSDEELKNTKGGGAAYWNVNLWWDSLNGV